MQNTHSLTHSQTSISMLTKQICTPILVVASVEHNFERQNLKFYKEFWLYMTADISQQKDPDD